MLGRRYGRIGDDVTADIFAERLQIALDMNGVTAADLEREDIASSTLIGSYIKGQHTPNILGAVRLAERLNVSLDWLCGLSDTDGPEIPPAPWQV